MNWMSPEILEAKIRQHMARHEGDYRDPHTGEVNMTMLVEDCMHYMDGGEDCWLDDSEHIIWEIAAEVADGVVPHRTVKVSVDREERFPDDLLNNLEHIFGKSRVILLDK